MTSLLPGGGLDARQGLIDALRDGHLLLQLLDAMTPGCVDWRRVHQPPLRPVLLRPHSIENCNQVMCFHLCIVVYLPQMQYSSHKQVMRLARGLLQLPLVNISGEDIVNGQRKLLLAVLRQLMRCFW